MRYEKGSSRAKKKYVVTHFIYNEHHNNCVVFPPKKKSWARVTTLHLQCRSLAIVIGFISFYHILSSCTNWGCSSHTLCLNRTFSNFRPPGQSLMFLWLFLGVHHCIGGATKYCEQIHVKVIRVLAANWKGNTVDHILMFYVWWSVYLCEVIRLHRNQMKDPSLALQCRVRQLEAWLSLLHNILYQLQTGKQTGDQITITFLQFQNNFYLESPTFSAPQSSHINGLMCVQD